MYEKKYSPSELSPTQREALIAVLKEHFEQNMPRHKGIPWSKVQAKPEAAPQKLWSINQMEETGDESYYASRGFRGLLRVQFCINYKTS